jgi:hypothetical protein
MHAEVETSRLILGDESGARADQRREESPQGEAAHAQGRIWRIHDQPVGSYCARPFRVRLLSGKDTSRSAYRQRAHDAQNSVD